MARKYRSQLDSIDEINMTPLIDLTFLLLIIFMITAPLLQYGIDVSPPEKNANQLPEDNSKIISIDRDGKIYIGKRNIPKGSLSDILRTIRLNNPKITLLIRADGSRPYKDVVDIMKIAETAGIKNISLVTQAESR